MKTVKEANIGELLFDPTLQSVENIQPFVGFKPIKPTIYAGIFPVDLLEYDNLRQAVERLYLSDPSVTLEPNFSPALGPGWRIGFLGALHMEVFYIIKIFIVFLLLFFFWYLVNVLIKNTMQM